MVLKTKHMPSKAAIFGEKDRELDALEGGEERELDALEGGEDEELDALEGGEDEELDASVGVDRAKCLGEGRAEGVQTFFNRSVWYSCVGS